MPYLFVVIFSLLIMGPVLVQSWGVALLDFALTDHGSVLWSQPAMLLGINAAWRLLGYQIASKAFFLITLLLTGYLGIRMVKMLVEKQLIEASYTHWISSIAALFFLVNPFMYERMMTQPTIYFGVICLGHGLVTLLSSASVQQKMWLAGVFFGLSWSIFPHAIFMIAAMYTAYIVWFVRTKSEGISILGAVGIIIVLNLNWLLAPVFGATSAISSIASFGSDNIQAFLSSSLAPFDPILTNVGLYGFWGERYGQFALPGKLNSNWIVAMFFVFAILITWVVLTLKSPSNRKYGYFFLSLALPSLVLWVWDASPWTAPFIDVLYAHIPYFIGFREPQKWIGIVMIAEAFFFLIPVAFVFQKWGNQLFVRIGISGLVGLILAIWTPGVLFAFAWQLRPTLYPSSLDSLRNELLSQDPSKPVLALPWHSYVACPWTHGVIVNPTRDILSPANVISADNIEVSQILYSNSRNPQSRAIESYIRDGAHDFSDIRSFGIETILLIKCADFDRYTWLDDSKNCKKIEETEAYVRYQCR